MNVRNCKSCGCIFNYVTGPVTCPACREKLEEKFQEVKEYIRKNKGAGIPEVAKACDVDAGQIRQWLREERLELSAESAAVLTCEKCGQAVKSGRFCEKCTLNMSRGFQELLDANKHTAQRQARNDGEGPKMRYLK